MVGFPNKKYDAVYADPPWQYKDKIISHGGGAESHYPTMSIKEICELPICDITKENCCLFMWVTMPFLQDCFSVIESWGFKYKTCAFVWVKSNKKTFEKQVCFIPTIDDYMGMGHWTRANAEICLLATKGNPKRLSADVRQVIYSPVRKHSQKPIETYKRIDRLIGGNKIELFARNTHKGWDSWGNEIGRELMQEEKGLAIVPW